MQITEALEGFRLYLQASTYAQSTIYGYMVFLTRLSEQLGPVEVENITTQQLVRFMAWLQTEYRPQRVTGDQAPLRPTSVIRVWCAIRTFFRWHETEFGNSRPDKALKHPKVRLEDVVPFTKEDCAALVKAARAVEIKPRDGKKGYIQYHAFSERNIAIIMTLLDTGVRIGELSRMEIDDLNLTTGEIQVKAHGTGRKTAGRVVYVGKATRNALWKYLAKRREGEDLEPHDPLFANIDGVHFSSNGLYALVTRIGKRAGVKRCHPHRFRHTAAIEYLRTGGDAFTLQKLLGHTDLEMTKHYVAIARGDVAAGARRFGVVDHWKI